MIAFTGNNCHSAKKTTFGYIDNVKQNLCCAKKSIAVARMDGWMDGWMYGVSRFAGQITVDLALISWQVRFLMTS